MDIGHVLNVGNKNKLHQNIIDAMRSKGFIQHFIYIKVSMGQLKTRFGILKYWCYIQNIWRKNNEEEKNGNHKVSYYIYIHIFAARPKFRQKIQS